jgi:hypothetical protein
MCYVIGVLGHRAEQVSSMSKQDSDRELFERAYAELVQELPESVASALARLRGPGMRWVRVGVGVAFVIGGVFSFLPVLGIELLPFGVLLLAEDIAVLHRPVATGTLWLAEQVRTLKSYVRKRAAA